MPTLFTMEEVAEKLRKSRRWLQDFLRDHPYPKLEDYMTDREKTYRNALMWAFDRLGVGGGMTEKEQLRTMREIGNVLCGRRSPASAYEPNDWDSSAKLPVAAES